MNVSKITRRAFLTKAGIGGAALGGYSGLIEPGWLDVTCHDVNTGIKGEPIKLLHMSDLHASWCVSLGYINEAIEKGLALKPDLICVTGDFITTKFEDFDGYVRVLAALPKAAPTFASLGNHDGGCWSGNHSGHHTTEWVRNLLQKSGIELLHNRSTDIALKNRTVRLVGVGDLYAQEVWPEPAFAHKRQSDRPYTVLMAHNPDTKDIVRSYPWDLMLSGHTHGGQISLPLIGTPFAPVVDKRFVAGMCKWENRRVHITKGVGNMFGLRFNCRPEINLLTLA